VVCCSGYGGWVADVVAEHVSQILHQRLGLGAKVGKDYVGTPTAEKFDEAGWYVAFQEGSSTRAPEGADGGRLVDGAVEGVGPQILRHHTVRDVAGRNVFVVVGMRGVAPVVAGYCRRCRTRWASTKTGWVPKGTY